jgi:hypothetical protein
MPNAMGIHVVDEVVQSSESIDVEPAHFGYVKFARSMPDYELNLILPVTGHLRSMKNFLKVCVGNE